MVHTQPQPSDWLTARGELAALVRAMDWSRTPLGPRDRWSTSLRTTVNLVLECQLPMALLWGRELILIYNDAYRIIAAGKHPDALGRSTREIWSEVWHINEPIFAAVLDRGEAIYLEDKLFPIQRHGRPEDAYFTLCYSPVRGDDGRVAGSLVTLVETTSRIREHDRLETERRRAESALREREERLRLVIESTGIGVVFDFDPQSGTFQASDHLRRHIGLPREAPHDFVTFLRAVHPSDRERVRALVESVLRPESGGQYDTEYRTVGLDGSQERWLSAQGRVTFDASGRPVRFLGLTMDITERKRAEQALRDSEEELRALYEQNPAMVVLSDLEDGRIIRANDGIETMLGFSPEEVRGRTPVELGIFPSAEDRRQLITAVRASGGVREMEITLRAKSGQTATGLLSSEVIRWGERDRLITVVSDITARKRAELALSEANERLREADRRKDEFLAMLAHELRNPLAPIRSSVFILERTSDVEQMRRARETIARQVLHLTRLVGDLLDVNRLTRGRSQLQVERLDLVELVARSLEDHRETFADRQIEPTIDLPEAPVWVDGDATRLAQAVGNLLENASKFTPGGGRVDVRVATRGSLAVISVKDTGVGISPELMSRLFEPFSQADHTLDRSAGGLGLGLALVKGITNLHHGEVRATSEGPGRGTEVTISLPLAVEADRSVRTEQPLASPGNRRVLIIEDNVDAADSLKESLELDGHRTTVAYDGPAGIEEARTFAPEVVLCDIGLPGMSGYDVARSFRSDPSLRNVVLVAVTGYAAPEDRRKTASAGFDHHVAKPPDMGVIARILAEVPNAKVA